MRKWPKYFFLVVMLLGGLAVSCKKNDLKQVENLTGKSTIPAEVATGVEIIYSDSAKVRAQLKAPQMVRYLTDDPSLVMPKGLDVKFFDTSLHVTSTLKANYGIRYLNKGITVVRGNVRVVTTKGDSLNTEELNWNEQTEKVFTNKFVKVKTKTETILAEGFESDINFTKYTFYNIRGTIPAKE